MKKFLLLPILALATCMFYSCGEDEPEIKPEEEQNGVSAEALKALKTNQVTFGNWKNVDVISEAYSQGSVFNFTVRYYDLEKQMGMHTNVHIDKSLIGKTIDLASPHKAVGDKAFEITNQLYPIAIGGIYPDIDFGGAFMLQYSFGEVQMSNATFRVFGTDVPYMEFHGQETCFKEGSVTVTSKNDGVYLNFNGTLKDEKGMVIALKGYVPAEDIHVYEE